jgi:hypothetical protein
VGVVLFGLAALLGLSLTASPAAPAQVNVTGEWRGVAADRADQSDPHV